MQEHGFNFTEITLLHCCCSVHTQHISSMTSFLESPSEELLLYIVLNIEIVNVEVISKKVKNCLKYISVL